MGMSAAGAQTYRVGGFTSAVTSTPGDWGWDGGQHTELRTALGSADYFGPTGIVATTIQTVNLTDVAPSTLATVDCLVIPWVQDGDFTADEIQAIRDFFLAGGDLFLLQDGTDRDPIGENLGIPTAGSSDGSISTGTPGGTPFFNGSFGTVAGVTQEGQFGLLSEADINTFNGTIAARNASNQVTAALWGDGQYTAGAGKLVVLGDVDMISGNFGAADYGPPIGNTNDKGRFGLNIFAFLATGGGGAAAPEPGAFALLGIGLVPLAAFLRRRPRG